MSPLALPLAFVLRSATLDVKTPFSPLQSGSKAKRFLLTAYVAFGTAPFKTKISCA